MHKNDSALRSTETEIAHPLAGYDKACEYIIFLSLGSETFEWNFH